MLLHGDSAKEKELVVDTTVQEKNITFPTDTKLHGKMIRKCLKIAACETIALRRSYRRTLKTLQCAQRGRRHPMGYKIARRAARKIRTIAGRLVREMERKLAPEKLRFYAADLALFKKVLSQKKDDSNKIYSLHEPHVYCMSKGKDHKKYEFGSKVSIGLTK